MAQSNKKFLTFCGGVGMVLLFCFVLRNIAPTEQSKGDADHIVDLSTTSPSLRAHKAVKQRLGDGCEHVFLDLGSNTGVQVRKLYESSKYPGSFLVSQFAHHFGSGPRDNVCAFAFEPNPRHYPRLREIEAVYNSLGWRVMMIPAAVGIRNSTMYLTQPPSDLQQGARVSSTKPTHGDVVAVPIIDLVEFLREHITSRTYTSRENSAGKIVCKMDIEGAEFQVLPAMLTSGQLCALDVIYTEFHNRNAAHFLNSTTPVTYDRIMKLRDSIQTVMTESDQCSTLVRSLDDESYGRDSLASKPLPLYHGAPQHCADKDARCILTKPLNGMSEEEHRNSVLGPF